LKVSAAVAVRIACAAAVLTAAVVVYALSRQYARNRRLRRELASYRLTAGCMARDLEQFRRRLDQAIAQERVTAAAGRVLDEALAHHNPMTPPTEGGTP
jgi:hypothetical protein